MSRIAVLTAAAFVLDQVTPADLQTKFKSELAQARDAARLAAIDAPNIDAFGLVINLRQYTPTPKVDRMIQRAGDGALASAGAAGRAVRHDIDVYLEGLNARLKADGGTRPWTRGR